MEEMVRQPYEMTDAELLHAYQCTTGRANDMIANALRAEIECRHLDI